MYFYKNHCVTLDLRERSQKNGLFFGVETSLISFYSLGGHDQFCKPARSFEGKSYAVVSHFFLMVTLFDLGFHPS